ncbi:MAG: LIC12162 family protein [Desulfovibrio sp.]|jgi:putative transferase (TIGR04331 family)|nr:LIC12162 family protein [Desulfovibrio sp.]
MEKVLILGAMPEGARPENCFAAGPWCFIGREALFPDWERRFTFAPEPLQDPACLRHCAGQALLLYGEVLPALAEELSPGHSLPPAYWETLLTPWGVDVARQTVERWMRIQAMLSQWHAMPLLVPVLPADCSFSFASEHDFTLYGALGTNFNHWLLSRLLEAAWPKAWHKEMLPPVRESHGSAVKPPLLERARLSARRLALRLPFPPLKGVSLFQSLRFSLALLHTSRGKDRSCSPTDIFEEATPAPCLPLPVLPMFMAALPQSLRALKHPRRIRTKRFPRVRVAGIQAYEDEIYRRRLAVWRGGGHRLAYVQHGAGYGQSLTLCLFAAVEYSQHAFITWGWRGHKGLRGNFIPLPYPQLARVANKHQSGKDVLFVGTEMPLFPYRLDAWPTPLQVVDYRQAKARFFAALPDDIRAACLYRPYFPVPGTLADADWLLPQFPQLRLCSGPLNGHMLSCRLLVLDHPGTTMQEALAANVPMLLYWARPAWPMTPESENMLDELAAAGIWHSTPEQAALAVGRVFADPVAWWRSAPVRTACRRYADKYAMTTPDDGNRLWVRTLGNL